MSALKSLSLNTNNRPSRRECNQFTAIFQKNIFQKNKINT